MVQVQYVDGPMVFATKPLYQLAKQPNQTWLGLQHVILVSYYNDIEDYELLLNFIVTDKVDIRHRDSFNNTFKFLMNYEETVTFANDLKQIYNHIVNPVLAGSSSSVYTLMAKGRNIKFQSFINGGGKPIVEIVCEKPHDSIVASVQISLSKFQEFVTALHSIVTNWHNTLTTVFYQFDRLGRGLVYLDKSVNERISKLENTINELKSFIQKLINQPSQTSKVVVEEDITQQPKETKQLVRSIDLNKVKQTEEDILNKLSKITQMNTKPSNQDQEKLPLNLIDHIELLKPYVLDPNLNLLEFAKDNFEDLQRIFVESGIPEVYVQQLNDLLQRLFDLKAIFEGKSPTSTAGIMMEEILKEVV